MKQSVLIAALALFSAAAPGQVLDRIVAVVDNEMILESQLTDQVQFFILNNKMDPNTPNLREQVLQSLINEKLIVAKAVEDSITVTEDEVTQQMDAIIQQRVQQAGSEARLEEAYGMPISRIKREFRDEMKKNLLAQKLQQQRFGSASIGRLEVEEFFNTYKDSLGQVPEEVELAHIFVQPKFDESAKEIARTKLQRIADSLKTGTSFADLAKRHSQDPGSATQGGDLGLVRRGQFVKEFESAVFGLKDGEVSPIVETDFGVHIIQLLERRGDAVRARHILIRVERTQAGEDSAIALLNRLRDRALAGENFAELAQKYSENKETAIIGGSLGTLEPETQLDKNFYPVVAKLTPGQISEPVKIAAGNKLGYQIVLLKKRTPAHKATLDQDYRRLETLALNYKRNRDYTAWLDELKKKIYWQVRL